MADTKIEWTQKVWNPITGCTKLSPGCANCYAETVDHRFDHDKVGRLPWAFPASRGGRGVTLHPERLDQPFHWKKPRRIFVNSMSDLFHEDVPEWFIAKVFAVMAQAPQHTFQVLTKRQERMRDLLLYSTDFMYHLEHGGLDGQRIGFAWPLPNVWLGVSIESQYWADRRIPFLVQTPAAVRFLSCEPLLRPVDLKPWLPLEPPLNNIVDNRTPEELAQDQADDDGWRPLGFADAVARAQSCVNWIICGGESGPNARQMHPDWVRQIRDDCQAAGVPLFVKQDSGLHPGRQGLIPDDVWVKEFPNAV